MNLFAPPLNRFSSATCSGRVDSIPLKPYILLPRVYGMGTLLHWRSWIVRPLTVRIEVVLKSLASNLILATGASGPYVLRASSCHPYALEPIETRYSIRSPRLMFIASEIGPRACTG